MFVMVAFGPWFNDTSFVFLTTSRHTELVSINGYRLKKIYKDSIFALPVASGKLIVYTPVDPDKQQLYIISADYEKDPANRKPKKIPVTVSDAVGFYYSLNLHLYWLNRNHELWELNYLLLKKEKVGVFENIFYGFNFYISDDEKGNCICKSKTQRKTYND